jgi:hypothetical protein
MSLTEPVSASKTALKKFFREIGDTVISALPKDVPVARGFCFAVVMTFEPNDPPEVLFCSSKKRMAEQLRLTAKRLETP